MGKRVFLSILFLLPMISFALAVEQKILDTKELAVVYDAGIDRTGRQALAVYPGIKQELETLFQWALDFRPTLVLLNDKKRFRRLAGHDLVVAYALPNKNVVVIDHSKMNTSPFTLQTTFKHELCHLLLHHYIRDDNLPRWLDEGICQWASDGLADIIMDAKRRCVRYQYIQIPVIFDLIQCHSGNHSANLALHLLFGVQVLSVPVMKCTSQATKEPSFESYYPFINTFAS